MNFLEKFKHIQTFIFDVDGVLTNNRVIVLESGELLRQMSARDAYAIQAATEAGYRICVISGGQPKGIVQRLRDLGVRDIVLGSDNKLEAYEDLVSAYELNEEHILYMGDDWPDYQPMRRAGLPCCPADAVNDVKEICQYVSAFSGGEGCVRDVIEKVMKLQDRW